MPSEIHGQPSSSSSQTPTPLFSPVKPNKEKTKKTGISVVLRVRPLSEHPSELRAHSVIQFSNDGEVKVQTQTGSQRMFKFDVAFEPDAHQRDVFEQSGVMQMLEMAMQGYSCTVFAYGQTGSGKTHTVTGPPEEFLTKAEPNPESFGLLPRAFIHLFELLQAKKDTHFRIQVSYFEIYNEQLVDLLNPRPVYPLNVRWRQGRGFFVENLFVIECESADDLMGVLETGMRNRAFNPTHPNEFSSRSHSIFNILIDSEQIDRDDPTITYSTHGKMVFVDLAGSEKARDGESLSAEQMLETQTINRSLLVLGNCINALAEPKKKGSHIPIRDSKLTKLLSDCLGGDGVTLMVACVSSSSKSVTETMSTLRYAARARQIINIPEIHADPREQLIRNLKAEIRILRKENNFLRNQTDVGQPKSPTNLVSKTPKKQSIQDDVNKIESSRFVLDNKSSSETNKLKTSPTIQFSSSSSTEVKSRKISVDSKQVKQEQNNSNFSNSSSALTSNSTSDVGTAPYPSNNGSEADYGLYEMLQEYMVENEGLRSENSNLNRHKTSMEKQYRDIMKENESLTQRVEQLEKIFQQIQLTKQVENKTPRQGQEETTILQANNINNNNATDPTDNVLMSKDSSAVAQPLNSYFLLGEPNYLNWNYRGPEQGFVIPYSQYQSRPFMASMFENEYYYPKPQLSQSVPYGPNNHWSSSHSHSPMSADGFYDSQQPTGNNTNNSPLEFPQEYYPMRSSYQPHKVMKVSPSHVAPSNQTYRRPQRYFPSQSSVLQHRVRTYERNYENIRQFHYQYSDKSPTNANSKKNSYLKPLPAIGSHGRIESHDNENMNDKLRRELEELDGIINRQRKVNLLNHEITQRTQKL